MEFLTIFAIVVAAILGIALLCVGFYQMVSGFEDDGLLSIKGWLIILAFAVAVSAFIYEGFQYDNRPFNGHVIKKVHYASYTTYVLSGKVMVPITYPERWGLIGEDQNGNTRECDVTEEVYETVDLGQNMHCGK